MLAQTTLRAVLGQHELDEMLSERKKLSEPALLVQRSLSLLLVLVQEWA